MKNNKKTQFNKFMHHKENIINHKKPRLVIVSDDIRRDSHSALKYLDKIDFVHLYRNARYGDMKKNDFAGSEKYKNPIDLYKKLKRISPDIVQGPEPYASKTAFFNSLIVLWYSKTHKKPYLFPVFENVNVKIKFGKILGFIIKKYFGFYANNAKKIIAINDGAIKNLLDAKAQKNKIIRMLWGTWGVDKNEFFPKNKLKTREPSLLFVGKIEKQKGILTILKAFKIVKKRFPKTILKIIGFGSLVDKIKKIKNIEYVGLVKNKDIPQYFQAAWITLSPSIATKTWAEQVGMVNIQSIACATPVVTTNSGSIAEFIPNKIAGLLIAENDQYKLASAIIYLIDNEKYRKKISLSAYNFSLNNYDAKKNVLKAQQLLLKIVNNEKH